MQILIALAFLSLLWAAGARADAARRAAVQSDLIPAPERFIGAGFTTDPTLPDHVVENIWHPFVSCHGGAYWSIRPDAPAAVERGMTLDAFVTVGYRSDGSQTRDPSHALVWVAGKWVARTDTESVIAELCPPGSWTDPKVPLPSDAADACLLDPKGPKVSVTVPPGTQQIGLYPLPDNNCISGVFRYRIVPPPSACTSTSAPDYAVPRDKTGGLTTTTLLVAQLACDQIGADLAPVTSKNAADVVKAGIDCIGLGKQALVASWDGNSHGQPGLLLTLPRKAGKAANVNVADASTPLPPICKLRKAGETEYGLVVGADSPIRVVVVADSVDAASAAAVCTRRGYSLADLKSGSGSDATFTKAIGIVYQALGSGGKAWIHSYDGDSYAGSCVAITAADSASKAGSVNVPAGGCTAKLSAVVCQTAAASTAPMQRRSEL
ncbi:hypothetical protein H9P43_009594 [Blastocladiella emersonii ATCC 22665]|nr:hypothetical protein H9P43_009594 [Blastocladiella emersonii ATCC 22665]